MAKPGPKSKPTKLKLLQGNPGKRPLPKNEPKPKTDAALKSPKHLDAIAKKEWRRMAKQLHALGLLTDIDKTALAAYCTNYSLWVKASLEIQKTGMLIKAQSGFPMQSPYLQIANKAQGEMRKWLVEFGMTPSSRAGLNVETPKPKSKAQEFRERQQGVNGA